QRRRDQVSKRLREEVVCAKTFATPPKSPSTMELPPKRRYRGREKNDHGFPRHSPDYRFSPSFPISLNLVPRLGWPRGFSVLHRLGPALEARHGPDDRVE